MYNDYYGLQQEPFNITPDPRFIYFTEQHQEALNHLLYGIRERKGFTCLTGEVGAGKTTLCRALLESLGETCHTALILNPMLTETQLLRAVIDELGIQTKRRDRLGYLHLLNEYLLKVNVAGQDVVMIIDEAQDMPNKTLEMMRLLSNLETHSQKLLQIVLVGQPELRERLAKPKLRQLAQRITVRYHLRAMTPADTREYICHRLRIAGQDPNGDRAIVFDPGAIHEIFRYSRGTPRLVNAIGDKALLAGYVHGTRRINKYLVRAAVRELREAA